MSLLEPPAEKPKKTLCVEDYDHAVAIVVIVALWFSFRYYPRRKRPANSLSR